MPPFMLDNGAVNDSEASSSELEDDNPKYQREASPPHEEVLADNPDIAVSHWRVGHVPNRVSLRQLRVRYHEQGLINYFLVPQFITMFRARFSDAFSQKLIHFGPQDIERGVMDLAPSPQIEQLLCALLALVLNRKKPVEYVAHIIVHLEPTEFD